MNDEHLKELSLNDTALLIVIFCGLILRFPTFVIASALILIIRRFLMYMRVDITATYVKARETLDNLFNKFFTDVETEE